MKILCFGYGLLAALAISCMPASAEPQEANDCRSGPEPQKRWITEITTDDMDDELDYLQRSLGYRIYSDKEGFTAVAVDTEPRAKSRVEAREVILCQSVFRPEWVRVVQLTKIGREMLVGPLLELRPKLISESELNNPNFHYIRAFKASEQDLLHPDIVVFYESLRDSGADIIRPLTWVGVRWYLWFAFKDGKDRIVPVYGKSAKLWLQKQCKERPSSHCSEDLFEE